MFLLSLAVRNLRAGSRIALAVSAVIALLLSLRVFAHDTWLLPRRMAVSPGAVVILDLTSGMAFPLLDHAIQPGRVDKAQCRLAGQVFNLGKPRAAPKSLQFGVALLQPGVATLWVELKPRPLELRPKLVEEYLDEIGASDEIRRVWADAKSKRWREVYTKHAKTFVLVGGRGQDHSWSEPVGMGLEIVPEKDPTALRAGDELPVQVLKAGTPLANFTLGLIREGEKQGVLKRTDVAGRVAYRLGREGRWLLRGTELRKSSRPDVEWESDFATLTIEVTR